MRADVRRVGGVAFVDVEGRITMDDGDGLLRERIEELLDGGAGEIVVNLESVPYVDSAGLAALVSGFRLARDRGARLRLVKPSPRVDDVLRLTGLRALFDVPVP
jgi:anti-sigma B factor antagonist